jgi:hypothetical protein
VSDDCGCDKKVLSAFEAVYDIIGDEDLQQELKSKSSDKLLRDLGLPESAGVVLCEIVDRLVAIKSEEKEAAIQSIRDQDQNLTAEDKKDLKDTLKILRDFFSAINYSFWISLSMSVILFVIGMIFMTLVLWQSTGNGSSGSESVPGNESLPYTTILFAGVGLADFLILFYTRPWQDISSNLSNAQRLRIIAITYQCGLAVIGQEHNQKDKFEHLLDLTRSSMDFMEKISEKRNSKEKTATNK